MNLKKPSGDLSADTVTMLLRFYRTDVLSTIKLWPDLYYFILKIQIDKEFIKRYSNCVEQALYFVFIINISQPVSKSKFLDTKSVCVHITYSNGKIVFFTGGAKSIRNSSQACSIEQNCAFVYLANY